MTNTKEYAKAHTYRIPMLDASIIYKFNGMNSEISLFKKVKDTVKGNEKYQPNTAVFNGQLKYCYETNYLEETYMNTFEVKKFSSETGGQNYTDAIVCVTFDTSYKEYNAFGRIEGYNGSGILYIRNGYKYDNGCIVNSAGDRFQIEDNICIADGSVIAVITGADTKSCKSESIRLAVLREIDNALKNQPEAKTVQWVLLAGTFVDYSAKCIDLYQKIK